MRIFKNKKILLEKNIAHFILLLVLILASCNASISDNNESIEEIRISWKNGLTGDFSFSKKWDYPEGIYKNSFGQLSCDGICPPETERMTDKNGRIYKDSLKAFYQLVDTVRQYHSIQSDTNINEWGGTNFITATKKSTDTTLCYTHFNAATHSQLKLTIVKNRCIPEIELQSIINLGIKKYSCKGGKLEIDENLWKKGIFKANFNFIFNDKENPKRKIFWKGRIETEILNYQ